MSGTVQINGIVGFSSDLDLQSRLHDLAHRNAVEFMAVDLEDAARRRYRGVTDKGTDVAVALPREQRLSQGAVLYVDDERAIVVRLNEEDWLQLRASNTAGALVLGYFAGNMHWRVKFAKDTLSIALEGPEEDYISKLATIFESFDIERASS